MPDTDTRPDRDKASRSWAVRARLRDRRDGDPVQCWSTGPWQQPPCLPAGSQRWSRHPGPATGRGRCSHRGSRLPSNCPVGSITFQDSLSGPTTCCPLSDSSELAASSADVHRSSAARSAPGSRVPSSSLSATAAELDRRSAIPTWTGLTAAVDSTARATTGPHLPSGWRTATSATSARSPQRTRAPTRAREAWWGGSSVEGCCPRVQRRGR